MGETYPDQIRVFAYRKAGRTRFTEMEELMARTGKNTWSLFLLLLAGIVLGSFIAHLTSGVSALSWLSFGQTFGLDTPLTLDLGVLILTFGLKIKFTIASIIGIVIAAIIYRFL